MSSPQVQLVGGRSPWKIVRAYPYITVAPHTKGFEVRCQTPDGSGWPFVEALESLTADEQRRYTDDVAAGREPAGTEEMCPALALMRLVRLVRDITGAEPPAWKMFYNGAHGRDRHPSAQAERVRRGRTCGER